MTVAQLYEKYMTPKNLQEHLLRVAALAKIICDNWTGEPLNNHAVVATCAVHDIAKPITFDVTKQAQYGMPQEDIDKLTVLQKTVIEKFGDNEHKATVGISKDSGLEGDGLRLLENLEWEYIPRLISVKDTESLLPIYCDMRIGPNGILTLNKRFEDLRNRKVTYYHKDSVRDGAALEEYLRPNVKIDLNSITDAQLNSLFPELLNLEI